MVVLVNLVIEYEMEVMEHLLVVVEYEMEVVEHLLVMVGCEMEVVEHLQVVEEYFVLNYDEHMMIVLDYSIVS